MKTFNHKAKLTLLEDLQYKLDYSGGANPIYIGQSYPGAATSTATWQIKKLTYDGNGNVTVVAFAGGTPDANQIWDNRATLSYS